MDVPHHDGVGILAEPRERNVAHELWYQDLARFAVAPAQCGDPVSERNPDVRVDHAVEGDAEAVAQDLLQDLVAVIAAPQSVTVRDVDAPALDLENPRDRR